MDCCGVAVNLGEGNGTPLQYSCLENPRDGGAWWAAVHGVARSWTRLSDFNLTFHFYALEREMATHSSVLAWRIPGTGEPGGLPSLGSHRVGHNWSDLAAVVNLKLAKWMFICVCVCVCVFGCTRCSCDSQDLRYGVWAPGQVGSVVTVHVFSCPKACGILLSQPGIESAFCALEGRVLTTHWTSREIPEESS